MADIYGSREVERHTPGICTLRRPNGVNQLPMQCLCSTSADAGTALDLPLASPGNPRGCSRETGAFTLLALAKVGDMDGPMKVSIATVAGAVIIAGTYVGHHEYSRRRDVEEAASALEAIKAEAPPKRTIRRARSRDSPA